MAGRIIPFPKYAAAAPRQAPTPNEQLLKAAKAAYSALLLAVPAGEQNAIVRQLGDAIRAVDPSDAPNPPSPSTQPKPVVSEKLSQAVAVQMLREVKSERCICGRDKQARRPFCKSCYHSLPDALRASMWLSPISECHHLLDRIIQARAFLRAAGVLSSEVIA